MNHVPLRHRGGAGEVFIIVLLLMAMVGAGTWLAIKSDKDEKVVNSLKGNLQQSTEKAETTAKELESVNQTLAEVRTKSESDLTARDQRITELSTELEALGQAKTQLAESSAATEQRLQDELATLTANLVQTQQAKTAVEQERSALETRLAEQQAAAEAQQQEAVQAITAMQEQKEALAKTMAEEKAAHQAEAETRQMEIAKLQAQSKEYHDALYQKAPEHATRLVELTGRIEELGNEANQLSSELAETHANNSALRNELETTSNDLNSSREAMEAAQASHAAAMDAAQRHLAEVRSAAAKHQQAVAKADAMKLAAVTVELARTREQARMTLAATNSEHEQAMAALQQQMDAEQDHAAKEREALVADHKTKVAALKQELSETIERATAALKAEQAEQDQQAAAAAATLATAKAQSEQALQQAKATAAAQLESQKMSSSREREVMMDEHGAAIAALQGELDSTRKAAAMEAERAMVALRSARLNQSALGAVYSEEVGNLRNSLVSTKSELETQVNMTRELGEMGASHTARGLVLTFGEAELTFAPSQPTPTPESIGSLDAVGAFLSRYPNRGVLVEGHTDDRGLDAYNQELSEKRAQSVHDALVERGIAPARIRATGYGESTPVASNNTRLGRSKNRRVDLVVVDIAALPPLPPAAMEAPEPAASGE